MPPTLGRSVKIGFPPNNTDYALQIFNGTLAVGVPSGWTPVTTLGETTYNSPATVNDTLFTGSIIVNTTGMVFNRCKVQSDENYACLTTDPSYAAQFNNCTIDGKGRGVGSPPAGANVAVGYAGFHMYRCEILGGSDGVNSNGGTSSNPCLIEQCLIHALWDNGLASPNDSHNDGWQITQGDYNQIIDSVVLNPLGETSAIMIGADQGSVSHVRVLRNILAGGQFTLYGGQNPNPPFTISDILIDSNRFSTLYYTLSGSGGATTALSDPAITYTNNTWLDGPNAGMPAI